MNGMSGSDGARVQSHLKCYRSGFLMSHQRLQSWWSKNFLYCNEPQQWQVLDLPYASVDIELNLHFLPRCYNIQKIWNVDQWCFCQCSQSKTKSFFYEAIAGCTRAKRKTTITREKQRNWKSTIHCSLLIKSPAPRVISPGQSAWQKCSLTIHPRRGWNLAGNATFKHQMSPVIHQSSVLACHVTLTNAKQQWTERCLTEDLGAFTPFTTRKGDADIS